MDFVMRKTCLRGLRPESGVITLTFQKANRKGTDQTAKINRLLCPIVVQMQQRQFFFMAKSIYKQQVRLRQVFVKALCPKSLPLHKEWEMMTQIKTIIPCPR